MVKMLLANPNLAGGLLACFLDNTVPGNILSIEYNYNWKIRARRCTITMNLVWWSWEGTLYFR